MSAANHALAFLENDTDFNCATAQRMSEFKLHAPFVFLELQVQPGDTATVTLYAASSHCHNRVFVPVLTITEKSHPSECIVSTPYVYGYLEVTGRGHICANATEYAKRDSTATFCQTRELIVSEDAQTVNFSDFPVSDIMVVSTDPIVLMVSFPQEQADGSDAWYPVLAGTEKNFNVAPKVDHMKIRVNSSNPVTALAFVRFEW